MDPMLVVFACIALGAVSVLCVTLSVVAVRAGRDINELKEQLGPVLEQTTATMKITEEALTKLDNDLVKVTRGIEMFESMASDLKKLQGQLLDKVRQPLTDVTSLFSGAVRGFTEFTKTLIDR